MAQEAVAVVGAAFSSPAGQSVRDKGDLGGGDCLFPPPTEIPHQNCLLVSLSTTTTKRRRRVRFSALSADHL